MGSLAMFIERQERFFAILISRVLLKEFESFELRGSFQVVEPRSLVSVALALRQPPIVDTAVH